jgi:hypothetical protein
MFNWYAAPTFGAMLLFWMLGAYVLTRSPRSAVSLTAVGAQFATAAYLLGQGMSANAQTPDELVGWVRGLQWGATIAPALWYWLTALLLREQQFPGTERYLKLVGYPLGIVIALTSLVVTGGIYLGDALIAWSHVGEEAPRTPGYTLYAMPPGPLYPALVALLAVATVGGAVNALYAWRLPLDRERRQRFGWLLVTAVLFIVGANALGFVNYVSNSAVPTWLGHLILAAAMIAMAWNVAAYSLLIKGQVIRRDFLYFLTTISLTCLLYGVCLFMFGSGLFGGGYRTELLGTGMVVLTLVVLTHAFADLGRRVFDLLFFGSDVERLRTNLATTIQGAGMTENLPALLAEAQEEIAQVSAEHMVKLTERALRRLNNPAALAECDLLEQVPLVLAAARAGADLTPLERARALRDVLTEAIERLKPPEGDSIGSPGALQYHILREEYLQGLLNKQIMARHSISEGTFNRNRRQAIATIARELENQERRLTTTRDLAQV